MNDDGQLEVAAGDRLAGIPRHSLKTGAAIRPIERWNIALEAVTSSNRVLVGDEGNDQLPLNGYQVINVRSSLELTRTTELFIRIDNISNTRYETFGALAELEVPLHEAPNATDPRFVAPGAPRSAFAGIRARF